MSRKKTDRVFKALADETRRDVLLRLYQSGEAQSITALAQHYKMSRQGLTKHINVLLEARLLKDTFRGREHLVRANAKALKWVLKWLDNWSLEETPTPQAPSPAKKAEEKTEKGPVQNLADFLSQSSS